MARPIRINIKGGYYHVINRGRNKIKIFQEGDDYENFLELIGECCTQYQAYVAAYCLMPNHYHLLICTPQANLPQFMRQLNGVYTQKINRRYHCDGTLFRGRYKAIIVQEEFYLMRVIRYIHLNPKKAGMETNLGEYTYSSHKEYMNKKKSKEWLKSGDVINKEWMPGSRGRKAYEEFMRQEDDKELETYYNAKKRAFILGEKDFVDEFRRRYIDEERYYDREVPEEWKMRQKKKQEEIEQRVVREYKIKAPELFCASRGKENEARKVAIRLLREHAGIECKEIAGRYGIGNPRGISEYCRRVKMMCERDKVFDRRYERLRSSLQVET
ncbi:MAG: transposase [Candidatus Omnitrophica bacterium]|nr:transposase [Candidatus Omnitrophota bacterium]